MERPFPAYQGDEPYIFVCYSHDDADTVYPELVRLKEQACNIWYDEGISPGEEWTEELADAIAGADYFLFFITPDSVNSKYCRDELGFAQNHQKRLVLVYLKETQLSGGLELSIGRTQAILKYELNLIDYSEKLRAALQADQQIPSLDTVEQRGPMLKGPIAKSVAFRSSDSPSTSTPWRQRSRVAALALSIILAVGIAILAWITLAPTRTPTIESLVVLPLRNLTNDPDQAYFVDGMTESLILNLSKIGALGVISRTSAMRYKGSDKLLSEIAGELDVDAIVEGSVQRDGGRVRINVQLTMGDSDVNLWADSFERDLTDILTLQREMARAIAREIEVALTTAEATRLADVKQVVPAAYEAYLKGRFHWTKFTPPDLQAALGYYESALDADPNFAPAHASIGEAWAGLRQMGIAGPETNRLTKYSIEKALELDPNLAEAHYALAIYSTWSEYDWANAEAAFRRAIELDPNHPDARAFYSHFLQIVGRPDEAFPQIERALDLDPFNPLFRSLYCVNFAFVHNYDEAITQCKQALKTASDDWLAHEGLRLAYHNKGMYDESLAETQAVFATLGDQQTLDALERGNAENGYAGAMQQAALVMATRSETMFVMPSQVAVLFNNAGQVEQAVEWIERGYDVQDQQLPYLKELSWYSDEVMSHPRIRELLARMNYPAVPP
jgi:TolB-like protein/tetratricopeptide (TPR) repeat protein